MVFTGVDQERNLHHHHRFWLEITLRLTIWTCPDNTADKHSETPKETDDAKETDTAPMSETSVNDGRNASHMKSKSSLDNTSGVRQRCELWCGDVDDFRNLETVKQGEIRESNTFLVSRLTRRRCDSRQNLEMAARVQSR